MGVLPDIFWSVYHLLCNGTSYPLTTYYLNESLLLAFAVTFPELQFWLMGILPIKAKWLGIFIGAQFLYDFFGGVVSKIGNRPSMLNFVIFFLMTRNYRQVNPKEVKRKQEFKSQMKRLRFRRFF